MPPSTTTTTIGRRGSGQPVTFAFAGDIHFEGCSPTSSPPIPPRCSRRSRRCSRRPTSPSRTSRPRSPRRHPGRQGVHVPRPGVGVHRARGRRYRRGEHGQQPRHGLRARRPRGLAHRAGEHAASRSSASATTRPRRTRRSARRSRASASRSSGRRKCSTTNLITAWTATDTQGGLASAKDVPRLVAAVQAARADERHGRRLPALGRRAADVPERARSRSSRARSSTRAPTSSSEPRAPAAWRAAGSTPRSSATASATSPSTRQGGPGTETGVCSRSPRPAATSTRYQFDPAVIRDGVPRPLDGDAAVAAVTTHGTGCAVAPGLAP